MIIANWDKWQTFRKDRGTPPWIKVYRNLLSNEQWVELTDCEKGHLVSIWILAADKKGVIPDSPKMIQRMAMLDTKPNINKFIELGFLTTTCQPPNNHENKLCPQSDAPEESRDRVEESTATKSSKPDQALEIFQYWCEVMKKQISTTKLTPKRLKAIKARLKDYEPHVIKTAVLNCSKDPFSMGQNKRQKPFNDIELICRNGEKLESFLPQATLDVRREKSIKQLGEEMMRDGDVPNQN